MQLIPAIDRTLEKEIPENVKVFRTKATDWFRIYTKDKSKIPSAGFANNDDNSFKGILFRFIRGNFFIPDPRKGWNRYAFDKACEIIETRRNNRIDYHKSASLHTAYRTETKKKISRNEMDSRLS